MTAQARLLAGDRLHLHHGPIDLIIGADGPRDAVLAAYHAAWAMFPAILPRLAMLLPTLRAPVPATPAAAMLRSAPVRLGGPDVEAPYPTGTGQECDLATRPVAARMYAAVWPYRDRFITPMAAVAGSVADLVLGAMLVAEPHLRRAYVNNGGDIALHLTPGATFSAGVVGDLAARALDAQVLITSADGIGGIATSGWRGRSQSLGIADSVTVLAASAAAADAAATMIANAVNIDDPAITRRPARCVRHDSDLGDLPVTVAVGQLSSARRAEAIGNGAARAREILEHKHIIAAYIQLHGETTAIGARAVGRKAA